MGEHLPKKRASDLIGLTHVWLVSKRDKALSCISCNNSPNKVKSIVVPEKQPINKCSVVTDDGEIGSNDKYLCNKFSLSCLQFEYLN